MELYVGSAKNVKLFLRSPIASQPLDFLGSRVYRKNLALVAQLEQVPQDGIPDLSGRPGSPDHSHALGLEENFQTTGVLFYSPIHHSLPPRIAFLPSEKTPIGALGDKLLLAGKN